MNGLISRMPLRVRLVVASTLLVAIGLAIAGFVAAATLRGYLVNRADDQLRQAAQHLAGSEFRGGPDFGGGPSPGDADVQSEVYAVFYNRARVGYFTVQPTFGSSYESTPRLPRVASASLLARVDEPFTVGSLTGAGSWRVVAEPVPGGGAVLVAQSLSDVNRTVSRLQLLELLIGLAVVVVLAGAGYVVVRRSLRPLTEVEHTAAAIAAGDLTQGVPEAHPATEVGRLSAALNAMLTQIERAFHVQQESEQAARRSEEQMRQFVADASHELRTPLAAIRGYAELTRRSGAQAPPDVVYALGRVESEAARMTATAGMRWW